MVFAPWLRRIIRRGTLTVIDANNQQHVFGDNTPPQITIRLHDRRLHWQLLLEPSLALGEGYMDGRVTIDGGDIYRLLELVGINLEQAGDGWGTLPGPGFLSNTVRRARQAFRWLAQWNVRHRARRHAAHHYELDERLYDLFLDEDRVYSCAYFLSPEDSLSRAQQQKHRHLASKLLLRPGQKVLDIGCGWGGLACYLAEVEKVEVVGVNVAAEQVAAARARAAERGLADRVSFLACDYRDVSGVFDRIVSVGFFEHVGVPFYGDFFRVVRRCLADDGVALLHTIGRPDGPGTTNPWLRKYIFPGGYSPALSEIAAAVERSRLWVTDVEVWRMHYAWTLRHWRQRFLRHWDQAKALYDERFCRMWEFYLAACEMTFRYTPQVVFQLQLAKSLHAIPYTRDYMFEAEGRLPLAAPSRRAPRRESAAATPVLEPQG